MDEAEEAIEEAIEAMAALIHTVLVAGKYTQLLAHFQIPDFILRGRGRGY